MRILTLSTTCLAVLLFALALVPAEEPTTVADTQPASAPADQPAEEAETQPAEEETTAPTTAPAAEEIITTDSGLQYIVLETGDGSQPTPGQRVVVHYHGTFEDGSVFDSSVDRGQPATFPIGVGSLIRAWDEAIPMMTVGSKWRLICPPDLAYGAQGRPGIPPNSTLIFEVELLGIR
jgi:FKBP-type peptidyl-prolyl cis-trans isomerase